MQRIMVIGVCGSGKSTFSRRLGALANLEVIHLDQYYWKPNWVESVAKEWETQVKKFAAKESWIIDGNYGSTMDIRFERADVVVFMDYFTINCLWRITKRIYKYWGKQRPDMPEGCNECFDLEFYHYVATYNLLRRKKILQKLKELESEKEIIRLRNDAEVEEWFAKTNF